MMWQCSTVCHWQLWNRYSAL